MVVKLMIHCNYEEIIAGLNEGSIVFVRFSVNNYSHYKNCTIRRNVQKLFNGKIIPLIEVSLTSDSSEKTTFLCEFVENTKLFRMGKKGNFTLKQLWSQISILEIVYI